MEHHVLEIKLSTLIVPSTHVLFLVYQVSLSLHLSLIEMVGLSRVQRNLANGTYHISQQY